MQPNNPNNLDDDSSLIERFRKGDERAFRELYDRLVREAVFRAKYFCPDEDFVQSAVSDIFIKIRERRKQFFTFSEVRAYLMVSVKNACINHLRQKNMISPQDPEKLEALFADMEWESNTYMVKEELFNRLAAAIAQLPDKQRETIELGLKGYSFEEISQRLGVGIQVVRNYKYRATEKLRELLGRDII